MNSEILEKGLKRKLHKRRIITIIIFFIFLIILITSLILRASSAKEVIYGVPPFEFKEIVYNENYLDGIIIGIILSFWTICFLLADLACCRIKTIKVDSYDLTIYRGIWHVIVYLDGIEKERLDHFFNYIELTLPNGVRATLSFSRSIINLCHISFSNDSPSIDL